MDHVDESLALHATPEMREAVRAQIVVAGLRTSHEIASALDLRHTLVVRMLERFAAVGAVRVMPEDNRSDSVMVDAYSLSERFRDLDVPLW